MSNISSQWYYLAPSEKQKGPVSHEEALKLYARGNIGRRTLVWCQGMESWGAFEEKFEGIIPPAPPKAQIKTGPSAALPLQRSAPDYIQVDDAGATPNSPLSPQTDQPATHIEQNRFFSFRGRVGREIYWEWLILFFIAQLIVVYGAMSVVSEAGPDIADAAASGASLIASLILAWPTLAISVKRWHDINLSGWMVLINLVPLIGWICSLICNGFIAGTDGPNRYGHKPTN